MAGSDPSKNPALWLPVTEGNPIQPEQFVPPASVVDPPAASNDAPPLDKWQPESNYFPVSNPRLTQ